MITITAFTDADLPVTLRQTGPDDFTVQYGKQVENALDYARAARRFGECVFHSLGKPQSWIYNCESANRRVDLPEFIAWAEACDVSAADAFKRFLQQALTEHAISGTTWTIKEVDGTTTAATLTLDDATNPTSTLIVNQSLDARDSPMATDSSKIETAEYEFEPVRQWQA